MSGPVYVFGGNPVQPGNSTYYAYIGGTNWTLDTTLELFWPFSFTSTGNPLRTTMTFQTTDNPGVVQLPDATEASTGQACIMWNTGSNNISLRKGDGTSLSTMEPNLAYWVVLIDNTSIGGQWLVLQYGAGTSGSTASSLAGYGLLDMPNPPLPDTLNVAFPTNVVNADYILSESNWGQLILCSGTCATITAGEILSDVSGSPGFFCFLYNNTSGPISIEPATDITINGSPNPLPFLPGLSCMLQFDNDQYTTIGLETNTGVVTSLVNIDINGATTYVNLTALELGNQIIVLTNTGATLTQGVTVYFGDNNNSWIVHNLTSSPFDIYLVAGTHLAPLGNTFLIKNNSCTNYYVNATSQTMVGIDLLPAVPNIPGLMPITSPVSTSGYCYPYWGGVAILKNAYQTSSDYTILNATPVEIISRGISTDSIVGNILIEGVIYISPSVTALAVTTLTIQRIINGGAPTDLFYQGANPIYSVASGLYRTSDLIPVPIHIWDNITTPCFGVEYTIYGVSTVGGAVINRSIDVTSATGVSYLSVTWFGASANS